MTKKNVTTDLVKHQFNGSDIHLRKEDGYVSATAMCKAAGKQIGHYKANAQTTDYLEALSLDIGIPISKLIQVLRGANIKQGTWVHPKVAIHLAQWLSAKFAVQVTNWVYDWMNSRSFSALPDIEGNKVVKAQILLIHSDGTVKTKAFTESNINTACASVLPNSVAINRSTVLDAVEPMHDLLKKGMGLFSEINNQIDGRKVVS